MTFTEPRAFLPKPVTAVTIALLPRYPTPVLPRPAGDSVSSYLMPPITVSTTLTCRLVV